MVGAISPLNNFTNTDIIWIKLKKEYFKETTDFFLGTVYFSPENYEKKYKKDYITQLEYEINHFKSKGEVIIQGDFNARVGNEKDIIAHSKYFDHDNFTTDINTNSQNTYPRNSYDNTVNTRGTDLLDLCIASDLYIVNGRKIGDTNGKYACFNWNGSSVVDYVITSDTAFDKILYFQVQDLIPFLSDHSALTFTIGLQYTSHTKTNKNLHDIPPKYIWNSNARTHFVNTVNTQKMKAVFSEETAKMMEINSKQSCISSVNVLTDLLKSVCKFSGLTMKKQNSKQRQRKKPWFDQECHEQKHELILLGKRASRDNKESELRKELCLKRKRFKKLIIKKKVENQANTLQKIISIKNNPKEYWRLLDSLRKNDRETNDYVRAIDSDRWVKMFKSLLQSGRAFDEDSSIPIVSNENIHPTMSNNISLTELKNSTKKLKHNKSAGLDQILNEMITCCVEVYPDIFLKLFNNLLHYGVFPEIWSQSMIVPLYKKGNKMLETNYRGITLLSCMGKFFNVIINERITNFAISNGIIKQEQFGFIKGNRTSDCLVILHSLADYFMNKKKTKLYTAFIDFQKAYDKVPRDILLSKLYSVGIRGDVFKVVKNIYQNEKLLSE